MAHELTIRATGKAEMAYVGDTPWHGLGEALTEGAAIEEWQRAAGMDWRVARSRVRYGEGPAQRVFDGRHVLFRSDTKDPLGIVSPQYKLVQPGEVLEFFRDLTEAAGFQLHTAGTLFGGRSFWALAKMGAEATVLGQDRVGGYLLLSTSCDGTRATQARFTTVRVVCNNTLTMAHGAKANVSIPHSSHFDAGAVKARLGVGATLFSEFMTEARALAKRPVTLSTAEAQVTKILIAAKATSRASDRVRESTAFQGILNLFTSSAMGGTFVSSEGTAWGLLNAVTEYVDHRAGTRRSSAPTSPDTHANSLGTATSRGTLASNRLNSAWFGDGEKLKNIARDTLLQLA